MHLVLIALTACGAPTADATESSTTALERSLAAGAALFPGVLVHGLGHYTLGDTETGHRLLAMEGVGAGLALSGLAGLAITGASRQTVTPLALMSISGVGLFLVSWLADFYGVLTSGRAHDAPAVSWLTAETGLIYVRDVIFEYDTFASQRVELQLSKRTRLHTAALVSLDDHNGRVTLGGTYRLFARGGPRLRAELLHHRYGTESFSFSTGTVELEGRYAAGRLADALAGSFFEYAAGVGLEFTRYTAVDHRTEMTTILLARFGYGFWFASWGELLFYYDHRHDDLAAGTKLPGLGSGVGGHFGLSLVAPVTSTLGLRVIAETGSAHVLGLSLVVRLGDSS